MGGIPHDQVHPDTLAAIAEAVAADLLRPAVCGECGRVFDLTNEDEAEEFYYGHDCEED